MNKKVKITLVLVSSILFLISLFNSCYIADGRDDTVGSYGLIAFLLGWMNASQSFISWFANPLYILAIIMLFVNRITALVISLIALGLAISFQFFESVLINEGGTIGKIDSLSNGYWLWLTSISLIFFTALLNLKTPAGS